MIGERILIILPFLLLFGRLLYCSCQVDSSLWLESDELIVSGIEYFYISEGVHKPSEYVWFRFPFDHYQDVNWTLEIKLIRVDEEPQLVYEKNITVTNMHPPGISWFVQLPEDAPAKYRFGVILWDHKKGVEGFLITTIKVRPRAIEKKGVLTMTLNKDYYIFIEKIKLTIKNQWSVELGTGRMFDIEKFSNGKWEVVPMKNGVFTLEMIMILPGEEFHQTIDVPLRYGFLSEGRYRVVKEVDYVEVGPIRTYTLYAEFTVPWSPKLIHVVFILTIIILITLGIRRRQNPKQSDQNPFT